MKNRIIKSESAKRILSYILPFYNNDPYMLHVFETIGVELDEVEDWILGIENQSFPQFATFTLPLWESSVGLESNRHLTNEQRRNHIVAKLSTYSPVTRDRVEQIVSSAIGSPAKIQDSPNSYVFNIILDNEDYNDLFPIVSEVKPAHLSYKITLRGAYVARVYSLNRDTIALQLLSGTAKAGRFPTRSIIGQLRSQDIDVNPSTITGVGIHPASAGLVSGNKESQNAFGTLEKYIIDLNGHELTGRSDYIPSGVYKTGTIHSESTGQLSQSDASIHETEITGIGGLLTSGRLSSGGEDRPSVFGDVAKEQVDVRGDHKTGIFETISGRYKSGQVSFESTGTKQENKIPINSVSVTGIGSSFPCGSRSSGEGVA